MNLKFFFEHWGASKNVFSSFGETECVDEIASIGQGYYLAIDITCRKGSILYLPCQRDFSRPELVKKCLEVLINSLITYINRRSKEIPEWALEPMFSREIEVYTKIQKLESKVKELKKELEPYQDAKSLSFLSEYKFEQAVPLFFETHLGIATLRQEKYTEDFWLIDSNGEKIAIAETKTYSRGFKKSGVYALYNHREANNLDETFPALLIINAHLNANSWKEKIRPIDPQDYKVAASNNILLVRIEDLLYFWNSMLEKKNDTNKLLEYLLNENGWMEVKPDGKIVIHR